MKKIILFSLLSVVAFSIQAQSLTATLTSASRLFASKDDLTSVIIVIPSGSIVNVLDSDSTYLHVDFDEDEGYIFKRDAIISKSEVKNSQAIIYEEAAPKSQPVQSQKVNRFTYLENKYGSNMAARLTAGKIWKGMNAEMVTDSWGTGEKVSRVISGNLVKEEWIYKNTWLYFENNILLEWGPVKK